MIKKQRVLLFHGRDKHPSDAWYPWLRDTCVENDIKCDVPQMPLTNPPVLDEWLSVITELRPNKETILIGHSRGGMAILRWLEKAPIRLGVKKVILIAANNPEYADSVLGDFYGKPYNFEKIKTHCSTFVQFHSKDDYFVPIEAGIDNMSGLEGTLLTYNGLEHFGNNLVRMRDIFEIATDIRLPRKKIPII